MLPTQFLRFAVIGLVTNGLLFLAYLLATDLGIGHKTAMTSVYVSGVLLSFLLNRSWTFEHKGPVPSSLFRYLSTYALGYVLDLAGLLILVDHLGFSHRLVQLVLAFAIAVLVFFAQRHWVFPAQSREGLQANAGK